jgi:hypothetical protein
VVAAVIAATGAIAAIAADAIKHLPPIPSN